MSSISTENQANGTILLRTLMVLLIFSVMNGMIFMVVLPDIIKEFHLLKSEGSWVITIYMVIYAIGSVIYGKLADRFQLKNLLTVGLSVFALGSLVGVLSGNFAMVLVARGLQAMGASVIPATSMIIPVRYFSPEKRGRAFGVTASGISIGAALGPIVSGLISGLAGWRYLFLFSLLPLVTLPLFRKHLVPSPANKNAVDVLGAGLLAAAVAGFLLAITQSSAILLAAGLVALVLFIVRIRTAPSPFIQPAVFKNLRYSVGIVIAFLSFGLNASIPFAFPQLLAAFHHTPPMIIGLTMFPAALVSALASQWGGRLADRRGNQFLIWIASLSSLIGLTLLSTFGQAYFMVLGAILILPYLSFIFFNVGMSNAISATLPKEQTGVGMGIFAMLNFIAAGTATSLAGKALDAHGIVGFNPLVSNTDIFAYANFFLVLAALPPVIALIFGLVFRNRAAPKVAAET